MQWISGPSSRSTIYSMLTKLRPGDGIRTFDATRMDRIRATQVRGLVRTGFCDSMTLVTDVVPVKGQFKPLRDSVNSGESESSRAKGGFASNDVCVSLGLPMGMVHDKTLRRFRRSPVYRFGI